MGRITWNEDLTTALRDLVSKEPPLGWDAIAHKMGFDASVCKKMAHEHGLLKPVSRTETFNKVRDGWLNARKQAS